MKPLESEAFLQFHRRLRAKGWEEGLLDNDRILTCDFGSVALTIWADYDRFHIGMPPEGGSVGGEAR